MKASPFVRLAEMARAANVAHASLTHFASKGLICPVVVDPITGLLGWYREDLHRFVINNPIKWEHVKKCFRQSAARKGRPDPSAILDSYAGISRLRPSEPLERSDINVVLTDPHLNKVLQLMIETRIAEQEAMLNILRGGGASVLPTA